MCDYLLIITNINICLQFLILSYKMLHICLFQFIYHFIIQTTVLIN
jgi:hypothetical protein